MRRPNLLFYFVAALAGGPVRAQLAPPVAGPGRAGVYRSAAHYYRRQLVPAGNTLRYAAKRDAFVVSTRRGSSTTKNSIARDSTWGYVDGKNNFYRVSGPDDYRVEQPDTITVYSRNTTASGTSQMVGGGAAVGGGVFMATRYYFSRGIAGRIFPLTEKNLVAVFAAGSPAFAAALTARAGKQELSAFDAAANAFYIVRLFRSTQGK